LRSGRIYWFDKTISHFSHANIHKNGKDEFLFVLCAVVKGTDLFSSAKEKEKTSTAIIYRDISKLWLMPQLPEDKPVVFQCVGASPHFDNEVTS